jgi:ATPase family associated with various cellular activities (AAA)
MAQNIAVFFRHTVTEVIMNLSEFKIVLLDHYDKHNGPFNWLASEYDLGEYDDLSSAERKIAATFIYTKYANTIDDISNRSSPIEKILSKPIKAQEFFELIVCSTLASRLKENYGSTKFCIGDCLLSNKQEDLYKLRQQFQILKCSLSNSSDPWIEGLKNGWGYSACLVWIDHQIAFLNSKIKSVSTRQTVAKNRENSSQKSWIDAYSVMSCDIQDYSDLTLDQAMANFERLVGLSEVKMKILSMLASSAYHEARDHVCLAPQSLTFNNFAISGPPGVGKTTSARLIAGVLAASNLIKKKTVIETTASALLGVYIGTTEAKIHDLFKQGSGGVIIIDEADSLASRAGSTRYHEGAIDTLNALIGYEKDNDAGTVVILTGYESGLQDLFHTNLGLRRRFPNYLVMPSYDAHTLKGIFSKMLNTRSYTFGPEIADAAVQQLQAAKDHMGLSFGNAGTVEEFISVMEAGRAQRIGLTNLRHIISRKEVIPEERSILSDLSLNDLPVFDKNIKIFKCGHLSLVSSNQIASYSEGRE